MAVVDFMDPCKAYGQCTLRVVNSTDENKQRIAELEKEVSRLKVSLGSAEWCWKYYRELSEEQSRGIKKLREDLDKSETYADGRARRVEVLANARQAVIVETGKALATLAKTVGNISETLLS